MTNKYYACYEQRGTGWVLVVYHDDKPVKAMHGGEVNRSPFWEVPKDQDFIDPDGSPNLGLIAKAFPNPNKV